MINFNILVKSIFFRNLFHGYHPLTQSFDARMLKEKPTTVRPFLSFTRKSKFSFLKNRKES